MHRIAVLRSLLVLFAVAALGGCATLGQPLPPAPTIDEIVQMSKANVPPSEIIKKMEDAQAVYWLKASELARLREQGVSDAVVNYMQQTQIAATWARAQDPYYWHGWGPYWGPYGPWGWYGPYWRPYSPYWRW